MCIKMKSNVDFIDSTGLIVERLVEEEIGLVGFDLDYLLLLSNDRSYRAWVPNRF